MNSTARKPNRPFMLCHSSLSMLRGGILLTVLGLAACNDTNTAMAPVTNTPTPPVVAPPVTPAPAKAARVEIVQTGLLFTERAQTRPLAARVFDADGAPLAATVRWESSDAVNISVSGTGLATAERGSGSTQITAVVDGIRSAPLLAVVSRVATGTVLVGDEQIVGAVTETDPAAAPSLDNTYTVVLRGIAPPAVDTLMVGTGSAPVAGRVVATREVAGGVEVTLKIATLPELFPGLEINQRLDLANVPARIPDSVMASHSVVREGSTYTFTPRPESAAAPEAKAGGVPVGTRTLFRGCEGSVNGVGLGDGAAPPFVFEPQPVFSFTIAPALDVLYTEARGLERFVVTAEPTFLIDGTVKATAAFEGKVSCTAELLIFPVPVGGALSVILSGLVPVGVGFEFGGEVTLAQLKLGMRSRTSAKAAVGLDCQGPCSLVNELTDFVNTNTPTVDVPGADDFRVKPELKAFGYVEAAIGNRFFRSLQFKAFEVKAGPKLDGEFAPPATQIAASSFKSSYKLSLVINAGFGDDIEAALNMLGVVKVGDEVLERATELAGSPTGVLTVDRERFAAGDTAQFELKLDPAAVTFLGLYNVSEIVLLRSSGGSLREIARVPATSGQTTFNFSFVAPDAGLGNEFTVFAVTRLLPSVDALSLELDTARSGNAAPVAADDTANVRMDSAETRIAVLANDTDANRDSLKVSAVSAASEGGQVLIIEAGDAVSYRPRMGFVGTETFGYTVIDGKGGSDEGEVQVQVSRGGVARLVSISNATRVSAAACEDSADDCLATANRSNEKTETPSTGFSERLETTATIGVIDGVARSSADGTATVTLDRTTGTVNRITLRCDDTSRFAAAAVEGERNISSATGRSDVRVVFNVEGSSTGIAYEIRNLDATVSAAAAPLVARASTTAELFTPSGAVFEDARSTTSMRQTGRSSGQLPQGRHTLNMICNTSGRSDSQGEGTSRSGLGYELLLGP